MIDINNSQDYDAETLRELAAKELRKSYGVLAGTSPIMERFAIDAVTARAKRELTDPIAFMKANYTGRRLWRYIQTHPDLDHIRGLRRLSEEIGSDNFWDTANQKAVSSFRSDADQVDWQFYRSLESQKFYTRGDSQFAFGRDEYGFAGGDGIEIFSPTSDTIRTCNAADQYNDISLVIRVTHAGRSLLLPGDAESPTWSNMVAAYGQKLKSDFLKASHHGRDSGYHMEAVRIIADSRLRWGKAINRRQQQIPQLLS